MTSMAKAFTQWVTRTQMGCMTGCAGSADISAGSWVTSIDMGWLRRWLLPWRNL
jgi:predicted transcriptional regulator